MTFRIMSGDISTDYRLFDTVLIADGRPPIALNKVSILDFQELSVHTDYGFSWGRGLPALAFGALCFHFGGALAFAAIVGLRIRHLYMFRITVRYYGTFIAEADAETYRDFLRCSL
mgnify:CR=1 FL=1